MVGSAAIHLCFSFLVLVSYLLNTHKHTVSHYLLLESITKLSKILHEILDKIEDRKRRILLS